MQVQCLKIFGGKFDIQPKHREVRADNFQEYFQDLIEYFQDLIEQSVNKSLIKWSNSNFLEEQRWIGQFDVKSITVKH